MPQTYYEAFLALSNVVLEESYVLGVQARSDGMSFVLDLALTPDHRLYASAPETGAGRWIRATVEARTDAGGVTFRPSGRPGAVDATGERDWGDVSLTELDDETWLAAGEWGEARLVRPHWTVTPFPAL